MGRHLSERERSATEAERELIEWKKVRFMADKLGEVFPGYVTGVQSFGLFVELDEIYVQGLVHVSSMTDDYYVFDEKAHMLKGENTRKVYRLGDAVRGAGRAGGPRAAPDRLRAGGRARAARHARESGPRRGPRGGRPAGRASPTSRRPPRKAAGRKAGGNRRRR